MNTDVAAAFDNQPMEKRSALPGMELAPEEWLLLRLYRRLSPAERAFVQRAIEALLNATSE